MTETPTNLSFKIDGMDCAEEVAILKREVGPIVGGEERLTFDVLKGRMRVEGVADVLAKKVVDAVARTGMTATIWTSDRTGAATDSFWKRRGRTLFTAASGLFGACGYVLHVLLAGSPWAALGSEGTGVGDLVPWPARLLYSAAIAAGVWLVLPKAWLALRHLRPDMNLLMVVAVVGAVALGDWFEAASVAFLFALSLTLESWSVGRARRAVEALMTLAPTFVRIPRAGQPDDEVAASDVAVGTVFLARPGERIPLDGEVVRGTSHVNQAPITGESAPVSKNPSDVVFAGTINGEAVLEIRSTKAAADTTLAHIIRMVEQAQFRRSPSEQWVEQFARWYTPAILGVAILIAIVPPLVFDGAWRAWFYNALVLLVIACPCALVISTPVSIVAALAAAARNGILIKGGVYMEVPARLKAIAFDKTGTLTEGRPSVVEVVPLSGHTEAQLLERVAAIEARSDHPLAKAIVAHAREKGISIRPADDFQIIAGKGATARFDGKMFWLGSHRYLEERKQETQEIHAQLESMSRAGRSVVVIGNESHVCGFITVADKIRPDVKATLEALRTAGIKRLVMLTGDNEATAEVIGHETGVDEVHAELLPADKVVAVETLVKTYGQVAMIGDGINDAPDLGRATVGIAMGAAGSDAAIETADIALMSDDLSKLPWLIRHSRLTLAIIRQNIFLSLAVKLVFVVLTVVGYAHLWAAIAADMGTSMLVIFNGLRLLKGPAEDR